jgi:arginyl-tRNA--protein-N-Asp/Glu arginylyltransferase
MHTSMQIGTEACERDAARQWRQVQTGHKWTCRLLPDTLVRGLRVEVHNPFFYKQPQGAPFLYYHCPSGALVAVGVVDILPRCLSSVYLFWDPPLKHLALGKLTALYELLWVRQVSRG